MRKDYDQYLNRHQVKGKLGELRPEYDKSGAKVPDCDDMVKRVVEAEQRSKKTVETS